MYLHYTLDKRALSHKVCHPPPLKIYLFFDSCLGVAIGKSKFVVMFPFPLEGLGTLFREWYTPRAELDHTALDYLAVHGGKRGQEYALPP